MTRRVAVIGAGAAGTMAAIFAAGAGALTILIERSRDGGRKILISGGGRCNILPARLDESRFVSDAPRHLVRKLVRSWPLRQQIAFFENDLGIPLVEEAASGKLFPLSNQARDVRDGLLAAARKAGAELRLGTIVTGLTPAASGGWRIDCGPGTAATGAASGATATRSATAIDVDAVVVATGGLSVPQTGSDGIGIEIMRGLGHAINPTYPALTPILNSGMTSGSPNAASPFAGLAGVSLPVTLTARDKENGRAAVSHGGFLFTHRGYSGPAVLDVSHVAVRSPGSAHLRVRWSPLGEEQWDALLRAPGSRSVAGVLRRELAERLALALLDAAAVERGTMTSALRRDQRLRLIESLVRGDLPWTGHEGYKKAEVTGGGVGLEEIDPRTLESRQHPGLYLCGEILDAFGPIGGYNFLWAWATGRAAGLGASKPA